MWLRRSNACTALLRGWGETNSLLEWSRCHYRMTQVLSSLKGFPEEVFLIVRFFSQGFPSMSPFLSPYWTRWDCEQWARIQRRVNVAQVEETRALRDAGRTAQKCPKRHWSMWRETASTRCSGSLPSQVFHWFCLHSTFKLLLGLDACKDSIYSLCLLHQRCFFIYSEFWDSYHSSFSCLTSEAVQE